MKLKKLPSFFILIIFSFVGCSTPPPMQEGSNQEPKIEIQVTGTESNELGIETISQPNCSGNAEVENLVEKSRMLEYVMEVQNAVSINANGQIGFAGTDVELGATVASQFGQSYGTSETLKRSITVKAKPGTNMQHIIRQVEIWKIGQAKISVGDQQTIIPFKFRSDFAIELVNSQLLEDCIGTSTASQSILLRWPCGNEYTVRANEPILIYYGGWAAEGLDLAKQWETALSVDLIIDGVQVSGEKHSPVADLPLNCPKDYEDSYWLYYTTTISGFSPGEHTVTTSFNTLRAMPDEPGGKNYEIGQIVEATFKIIAE